MFLAEEWANCINQFLSDTDRFPFSYSASPYARMWLFFHLHCALENLFVAVDGGAVHKGEGEGEGEAVAWAGIDLENCLLTSNLLLEKEAGEVDCVLDVVDHHLLEADLKTLEDRVDQIMGVGTLVRLFGEEQLK